ncbi:MAG: hypothetical protein AB7V39_03835 [Nitrospiraceae bacterium]
MRIFVRLQAAMISRHDLSHRLDQIDGKYDARFCAVFEAWRTLKLPDVPTK